MSRSVAPRSAPGGDWARAARSEGCSGVCVGDYEGIMNGASATAFLPNFVGFPSPRGLHSSTVQARSAPLAHTCAFTPPVLSTPLNVPQRSSAPARLSLRGKAPAGRRIPAHGEAPAGRRLPTDARGAGRPGRGSPSGAQLPRVSCLRHRIRPRRRHRTTRLRRTSCLRTTTTRLRRTSCCCFPRWSTSCRFLRGASRSDGCACGGTDLRRRVRWTRRSLRTPMRQAPPR